MDSSTLALIVAVVGVATIAARIIEKLVDHVVEEKKNKKDLQNGALVLGSGRELQAVKGGHTTDLALQGAALRELREDVEKVQALVAQIDRSIDQLNSKQDQAHEDLKELKSSLGGLRSALEGNTVATKSFYDLLASQLKAGR